MGTEKMVVPFPSAGGAVGICIRTFRFGWVVSAAVLFLLSGVIGPPEAFAETEGRTADAPRIEVSTEPEGVHPNTDFVTVHVRVRDLPASSSERTLKLSLDAPASSLLSTDFPVVEGTRLVDLNTEMTDSSFAFDYRFPIRGTYEINAVVYDREGDASSPLVDATRTIHVSEHHSDIRNASLLVAGLFLLGLLSGVVVRSMATRSGGPSSPGSGTTTSGILILIVSTGVLGSPLYGHGPGGHAEPAQSFPEHVENELGSLRVDVSTESPDVGALMTVNARFKDASSTPSPARFVVECVNLEEGFSVFRMSTIERSGTFEQRIQFVDGAPHQVRVRAEPIEHEQERKHEERHAHEDGHEEGPSLLAGTTVDVTAIAPPTAVVVRMMSLLLGVFMVGLIGGYLSQMYTGVLEQDSNTKETTS